MANQQPPSGARARSRYQAPQFLSGDLGGLRRQMRDELLKLQSELDRLTASLSAAGNTRAIETTASVITARENDTIRVVPTTAGTAVMLPEPRAQNRGQEVSVLVEGPGTVTLRAIQGLVQGAASLELTTEGLYVLRSDGADGKAAGEGSWWQARGPVDAAAPPDAEYVLGAADSDLPNGRVATDSTEIDAVLTTPNAITWALNLASVAFSKLADLAGLSVLGRSANSTGVMAAITASAARQVLRDNDAGTALEWGFPVEVRESGIDQGDVYVLDRRDGRATVSAGVATFGPPGQVSDTQGGTLNAYTLPATLRHGDTLSLIASSTITLNGIDATSVAAGFGFYLNFSDGGVAGRLLIINDESGSATATNRISTLDDIQMRNPTGSSFWVFRAATRWGIVDRSIVEVQDDGASQGFVRTLNALSSTTNAAVATVSGGVAALSYQRAALTGEATASANANAVTVTRSTNYQTSPWTGNHQFNAEIRLGTLQSVSSTGSFNITLTAGATRVRMTDASGNHTVGTISGAADGRVLVVYFLGTGTHTTTHGTGTNDVSCPGNADLVITGRGGYWAVANGTTWEVVATTN